MKPAQHLRCGGVFPPDPDLPADHQGRRTCICHLVGQAGDAHHNPVPAVEDGRMRAAGERGGEG